jgi:methylated-DNA-protein-cysteine methyltransferase related protein
MKSVQNEQHPGSRADHIRARVRAIPEGFVQTCGDIDPEAPRLVGRILAKHHPTGEPSSSKDIPWHRVVRFDGRPPLGAAQLALLRTEGVPISGDRVDLKRARLPRTHLAGAPADTR